MAAHCSTGKSIGTRLIFLKKKQAAPKLLELSIMELKMTLLIGKNIRKTNRIHQKTFMFDGILQMRCNPAKLVAVNRGPLGMVEKIVHDGKILAVIVRRNFRTPGAHFFTPNEFSQQLAYMRHPAGKVILPHRHNPVPRQVQYTQEVLVITRGILRVDFYDNEENYLHSKNLESGDVILLASGGHGFQVIEEVEMFEVKQGPYVEDADKTRFKGVEVTQEIIYQNSGQEFPHHDGDRYQ